MRLTIGKVAAAVDVSVETVRYYEREGLLARPPRSPAGYRLYTGGTIRRLLFIRRAQRLGFTLAEIRELLLLRIDTAATCAEVAEQAREKIADIDARIAVLQRMRRALADLVRDCRAGRPAADCPILAALDAPATEE